MSITTEQAAAWFADRAKDTPMPGARAMYEIAATALREKAERENPIPLTYDELFQMDGELVWLEVIDGSDPEVPSKSTWAEVFIPNRNMRVFYWLFGNECEFGPQPKDYGKTHIAYRHKPKEVQENA